MLLGVTGSGKTFTMAKVIEATQRPALVLAPNKTLAAQLYGEFKSFFPGQRGRVFRLLLRLLPARGLYPAHRHLYREGFVDQRADRPHAPCGDPRADRARRRHHRGERVLHLRYRLGRDLYGDDLQPEARRQGRAAPADGRSRGAAIPAQRREFRARLVPRARRHHRAVAGAFGGPRLAHLAVRRHGREPHRVRSPDRRQDRRIQPGQGLRQFALRDAEADAQAGGPRHQGGAEGTGSTSCTAPAGCSRRSGSSSARCSIWR